MRRTARTQIPHHDAGRPLLDYLCARFTYHTPDEWQDLLADHRILINGCARTAQFLLSPGDELEYRIPDLPEPPVDTGYTILYQDDHLLAIDKPGNLPCHPAGKYFHHTLWALLKDRFPDEKFGFVNRLDRETSGVVLVGRHAQAIRDCRRQFDQRTVCKRYQVLVEGIFPEEMECSGHLEPDPDSQVRKKRRFVPGPVSAGPARDWAVTRFRRLHQRGSIALVEALPQTGRLHQIRATLCSLGYPVVGDKLYGPDDQLFLRFLDGSLSQADHRTLRLPRQALHAASLTLLHPVDHTPLTFTAPLPADMGIDEIALY